MAQTRKRRRTKHRGNAAGMVEARGRTGRRPDESEKKGSGRDASGRKPNRLATPPTWRSAFTRSVIATAFFALLLILVIGQEPAVALIFALGILPFYVVVTYYTDGYFHRRYIRKQQAAKGAS